MKYAFQSVLRKARRKALPSDERVRFVLKNQQSDQTAQMLQNAGWKIEGRHNYNMCTVFGMTNGSEHINFSDWGKFPYHLGDTIIYIGVVDTFGDHYQRVM